MYYLLNRNSGLILTESNDLGTIQQWEDDIGYAFPELGENLGVFSLEAEGWVEYV